MKTDGSNETVIEVCHGPVCSDLGSSLLTREFAEKGVNVIAGNCRGLCPKAPLVHIDNSTIFEATSEKVQTRLEEITAKASCSNP